MFVGCFVEFGCVGEINYSNCLEVWLWCVSFFGDDTSMSCASKVKTNRCLDLVWIIYYTWSPHPNTDFQKDTCKPHGLLRWSRWMSSVRRVKQLEFDPCRTLVLSFCFRPFFPLSFVSVFFFCLFGMRCSFLRAGIMLVICSRLPSDYGCVQTDAQQSVHDSIFGSRTALRVVPFSMVFNT